jgi:hypothetical protein
MPKGLLFRLLVMFVAAVAAYFYFRAQAGTAQHPPARVGREAPAVHVARG